MVSVLLLNASYEPLAVIPKRRALSLLLRERVDAATDDVVPLRGISTSLNIPTVLRLRRYINVPRRGASWSRRAVLRRDNYTCIYCGIQSGTRQEKRILERQDFTIDHILPKSRGGRNVWTNTACACPVCNHRKGNKMPHEAGMNLRWEPKTPRVDYIIASGAIPEAWKMYLEI
ncbi:MAG: HNH endonuclease [Chloroflexi bacterium]|nr:MAG: HNH endonuclease [Chloroflexota bacterium]